MTNRRCGLTHVGDARGGPAPELPTMLTEFSYDGKTEGIFDTLAAEEEDEQTRWTTEQWRELLAPLTTDQRRVIVGLFIQGVTTRQLTAEMGVGRGMISWHKRKAIAAIRYAHPNLAECC